MDGAFGQALVHLVARHDDRRKTGAAGLGTCGGEFGGMAARDFVGGQQAFDTALGIGEGCQHGVATVEPDRLMAAAVGSSGWSDGRLDGRAVGAV
jgi:hypothetical protein